ncbi:PREDICTED: LMBR1 domain-containing protein 2 homolog B-like isoform X2 [Tarenaya hassleriana]|uniref:LMBR1 domain-containing protein 2 homolog B-like isoform X2 n=1 Tax=Tarenaya hassleriana TaxID=28532 RepID=UPI00053C19DC|nr:PREDICTED: LMBR1 domain-containing protein 2 homolog B-like isoform X2 [Tarenaya hassleriana]
MWVFYMISLPLTLGMVLLTLRYFAGPDVPRYVLFTVGYAWFCSLSIIILVPADIWTTVVGHSSGGGLFFFSWSYWSTFLLTWAVVPTIQGYEDAGDFSVKERLRTSIHGNLVFYLCVGSLAVVGLILLIALRKNWSGGILGFAMACSNTFGLVTGAFLLGFGLSEIPRGIWKNADWIARQKVLSHKVAKMALKLDDAHQEFSNAIVVAQATSNQMSKRDPLRPFMDVIDNMLQEMLKNDPSFKPQGGRLGENDMDYDTDEKTMAALRRNLRIARETYYRYKSEYMNVVLEALELEDTVKSYERRDATGWKYISTFRDERTGSFGSFLDAVGKREVLVQVAAFVPLMYMCVCTYYSLFKIGMLMFYSLTPRQTSSVSLLMICSMVARYAPPISYNFLNLIHLDGDKKTIFEMRMGNIDDAVPFFGRGFNKIYPLIMVIYTIIIASNFFDRVVNYVGNWRIFKIQDEVDETNGFDPSGLIILRKERNWLQKGYKVSEQVIPLARSFNDVTLEDEEKTEETPNYTSDENQVKSLLEKDDNRAELKPLTERQGVSTKYPDKESTPSRSLEEGNANQEQAPRSGSRWESMKNGFQNFKAKMEAKKSQLSRQIQEGMNASSDSSPHQSLDEIFERLKNPFRKRRNLGDLEEDDL